MKPLMIKFALATILICISAKSFAYTLAPDTMKLQTDIKHAYYQRVVKVDSVSVSQIYLRAIQFMASKNFQQTYGYQEEGKLIFTTSQDLNQNRAFINDEDEMVVPYTVQFAVTIDIKAHSYRYTINNVVFYLPTDNGNRRETLLDMNMKANNSDSRRVAKDARKMLDSFERYLDSLTDELFEAIKQKSAIYSKF